MESEPTCWHCLLVFVLTSVRKVNRVLPCPLIPFGSTKTTLCWLDRTSLSDWSLRQRRNARSSCRSSWMPTGRSEIITLARWLCSYSVSYNKRVNGRDFNWWLICYVTLTRYTDWRAEQIVTTRVFRCQSAEYCAPVDVWLALIGNHGFDLELWAGPRQCQHAFCLVITWLFPDGDYLISAVTHASSLLSFSDRQRFDKHLPHLHTAAYE